MKIKNMRLRRKSEKVFFKYYNKRREDFNSLREYNEYLEDVELIIFTMMNGADEEKEKMKSTVKKIKKNIKKSLNATNQKNQVKIKRLRR